MHLQTYAVLAAVVSSLAVCAAPIFAQGDLIGRAHQLDMQGDHRGAVALYRQALARDADSFDAQYGIGRALDLAGDYVEARQHFTEALRLAPNDLKDQTLRMLGISYVFTGETDEATGYFRQVYEHDRAAGNLVSAAEVANELGRVYLEAGDTDRATTWYRNGYDAAKAQADAAPWQIDLADLRWAHAQARIAAHKGDFGTARGFEADVKRLIDKGTNADQQPQYPYLVGYVDFYAGQYDTAIAELQKADQKDPFVLFLLAQAFEHQDDAIRARDYYQKTLASNSHAVNNAFVRRLAAEKLQAAR